MDHDHDGDTDDEGENEGEELLADRIRSWGLLTKMELVNVYMIIGFTLAAYSVIANDSVQTLGTFIASNSEKFKWFILAGSASLVLLDFIC